MARDNYIPRLISERAISKEEFLDGNEGLAKAVRSGMSAEDVAVALTGGYSVTVICDDQSQAEVNYQKIQAAIDTYNHVDIVGVGGEFAYISEGIRLKGGSNVKTVNCTLKSPDGSNAFHLVYNDGLYRELESCSVTETTGRVSTIHKESHGFARGDIVCFQGSDVVVYNMPYRISSIVSEDEFKVVLCRYDTTLPATINIKQLDKDITCNVDLDYNAANTVLSSGFNAHGAVFSFLADSDIYLNTKDTAKYGGQISASLWCKVQLDGDSNSDIFKVYGSTRDLTLVVNGDSSDDCVTIQAKEPDAYIDYQPAIGPISNIEVMTSSQQTTDANHSGAFVVYSDDENFIEGIRLNGGSLSSNTAPGIINIRSGTGFNAGDSLIKDITIKNTKLSAPLSLCLAASTDIETLVIDSVDFQGATSTSRLLGQAGGSIDRLILRNINFSADYYDSTAVSLINIDSTIREIELDNCSIEGDSVNNKIKAISLSGNSSVSTVRIKGGYYTDINTLVSFSTGANPADVRLESGVVIDNVTYTVSAGDADCTLYLSATSISGYKMINTSTANVTVYGDGSNWMPYGDALRTTSTGTITPYCDTLPLDITSATTGRASGAKCYSSVAAGTIPAGRPVISDGTSWFDMTNPDNSYT